MKKVFLIIPVALMCSCAKRIGDLTMVATRNIDSKTEYVELKRYVVAKGGTLEQAIDRALRETPGGEYMKNVVIYSNGKVEGDVWGVAGVLSDKEKKQIKNQTVDQANRQRDSIIRAGKLAERKVIEEQRAKEREELKAKFSTGDKVSWVTKLKKIATGEIVGKDEEYAVIKMSEGQLVKIRYKILTKLE